MMMMMIGMTVVRVICVYVSPDCTATLNLQVTMSSSGKTHW